MKYRVSVVVTFLVLSGPEHFVLAQQQAVGSPKTPRTISIGQMTNASAGELDFVGDFVGAECKIDQTGNAMQCQLRQVFVTLEEKPDNLTKRDRKSIRLN